MVGSLILSRDASAAPCAGGIVCRCGDTVTASYVLPGDLGPCPGHGLVVRSNVRLDCRGLKISGSATGKEHYGVFLDGRPGAEVTGATVTGCHVSGFMRGIRLRGAINNVIADNVATMNGDFRTHVGYGIDVSGESRNNLLERNTVRGNADEGIHIGRGSHRNRLSDNVVMDNYRESLYLLAADGGVFLRNTLGGTGVNSLYIKDSSSNRFEGNTFTAKPVRIIGNSHGNQLVGNTFSGAGLHITHYKDTPGRRPANNRITGGVIKTSADCLRFTSTSANVVTDTVLSDCRTQVRSESPDGPSENTLVGIAPSTVSLEDGSILNVAWRLAIHVADAGGAAVAGAQVQVTDATGALAFTAVTDETGNVPDRVVIASTRTSAATTARTPHTLTTSKPGYRSDVRTLPVREHLTVTISLAAD